jgi:hypothetical protein
MVNGQVIFRGPQLMKSAVLKGAEEEEKIKKK